MRAIDDHQSVAIKFYDIKALFYYYIYVNTFFFQTQRDEELPMHSLTRALLLDLV